MNKLTGYKKEIRALIDDLRQYSHGSLYADSDHLMEKGIIPIPQYPYFIRAIELHFKIVITLPELEAHELTSINRTAEFIMQKLAASP